MVKISGRSFPLANFEPIDNSVILTLVDRRNGEIVLKNSHSSLEKAFGEYRKICLAIQKEATRAEIVKKTKKKVKKEEDEDEYEEE